MVHAVFTITTKVDAAICNLVEGAKGEEAKEHCMGPLKLGVV